MACLFSHVLNASTDFRRMLVEGPIGCGKLPKQRIFTSPLWAVPVFPKAALQASSVNTSETPTYINETAQHEQKASFVLFNISYKRQSMYCSLWSNVLLWGFIGDIINNYYPVYIKETSVGKEKKIYIHFLKICLNEFSLI